MVAPTVSSPNRKYNRSDDGPDTTDDSNATDDSDATDDSTGGDDGTPRIASTDLAGDCPADADDHVVCYEAVVAHEHDLTGFELVLEPGSETVGCGETIAFKLLNRSETPFATNVYNWRLHKRVDGEWFHIAPQTHPEPLMPLAPGGTHAWRLTVVEDEVS